MRFKRFIAAALSLCMLVPTAASVNAATEFDYMGDYMGGYDDRIRVHNDVNNDGVFDVADLVAFGQWLHGAKVDIRKDNCDLNGDGALNIFDLNLLRRALIDRYRLVPDLVLKNAVCLTSEYKDEEAEGLAPDKEFSLAQMQFALDLINNNIEKGENTLVSPYSVMQALAMTANGADGNTKTEMEKTLGGIAIEKLNKYLYSQRIGQENTDKVKLSTANSIWARECEKLTVKEDFLKDTASYYGADFFKAPFDDTTVTDINNWVSNNTCGMIKKAIEQLEPEDIICLINASYFDAEWAYKYETDDVFNGTFTAADGTKQSVKMMGMTEGTYLSGKNAVGFMKYYAGNRYAFAAILPDEGITVEDYLAELTSEELYEMLANPEKTPVITTLPKFSYECSFSLADSLKQMGMEEAFDVRLADFTKMAEYRDQNVYIGDVIHKTKIDVFEEGTKAAAVTVVMMKCGAAMIEKSVYLDRPFVYAIVDTQTNTPIFIGTVSSID